MAGLTNISEMGKQGMLLSQFSIQITGKNISNINTGGYSRQRLDVNPILPELLSGFSLGSAINGDTLRRIREDFIDRQIWSQSSLESRYTAEESLLRQVEGVLPSSNDTGLGPLLDEFWSAWNSLANDPESSVARTIVRDRAQTLAQSFNRVHREFVAFQKTVSNEVNVRIGEINNLAYQIAELNRVNPGDNLDLEDQRDRLIDRLSELINIDVQRDGDSVLVSTSGLMLVSGRNSYEISVDESINEEGIGQITALISGTSREVNVISGELSALLTVYNDDVPGLLERLDRLAVTLVEQVNAIHQNGFNLSGITGLDFFDSTTEGASSIAVDSAISSNVELIASSDALGETGNGNIAKALADLADKEVIGNQTMGAYYRALVGTLGNRIQEIEFLRGNQEKIVSHLKMQRESVSGVSMEEEMTRMVQLEQAFTAASRLVSTADELTRTVLQMI
ncbi:MAG: flagellar hook-associated protein FlgK [Fidelibacterota bacterium]|nr:MAG: flagellar hook-associated protein FlgK [Candidatus Neomarinimicrobiota bacterium]